MAGCVALLSIAGRPIPGTTYISNLDRPGVRTVRTHFENPEHVYSDSNLECEWQEVERNGQWVREGPSVHWSPDHKKLVEGSYREGERDGPWTFWNADGSIEAARSGIYEAGVRVQPGPTPPGDYPVRPPPPRGYTQPR
jgi:hypothetical protein